MTPPVIDLVLLPGLDGSDALFDPLIAALPAHVRARVIPLPVNGPNGYDELAAHIRAQLGTDTRPVILAWSFSGPIGIRLAADPSLRIRSLILCASFACNPHPLLRIFGPFARPRLLALFSAASRAKALLGGYGTPELRSLMRRAHASLTPSILAARLRAVLDVDECDSAQQLRVPVLYLAARHDLVVPRRCARRIVQLCPAARVRVIAGPHLALATNPTATATAIVEFLDESAGAD